MINFCFDSVVPTVVSCLLGGVMSYRFFNSRKMMPAGVVAILRSVQEDFLVFSMKRLTCLVLDWNVLE